MIVVTCNDGQKVEIPEKYAPQSSLLKNLLEELKPDQLKKDSMSSKNDAIMDGRDNHVPVKVPLTSTVMRKILEYMEHDHATLPKDCISKETINRYGLKDDQGRLDEWEQQYCKMDQLTLFETIKVRSVIQQCCCSCFLGGGSEIKSIFIESLSCMHAYLGC